MSATSFAQVSQYFRSPHFSTILAKNRAGREIHRRERYFGRVRDVDPVAAKDDAASRRVVEVDLVDFGIEPVVVRTQRAQHAPDNGEPLVVVKGRGRIDARRHGDRQHDVAVLLARRLAHCATDGLHDVDLRVSRAHEQHGVERGHVDTLGQAARVRENAAGVVRAVLQPLDPGPPIECVMLSIDMARFAQERTRPIDLRQKFDGMPDDVVPVIHQPFR